MTTGNKTEEMTELRANMYNLGIPQEYANSIETLLEIERKKVIAEFTQNKEK